MFYIVFIIGIILSLINDKKNISFKIFVMILLLFAFFRYGIGADYFSYQFLYSRLNPSILGELSAGLDSQEIGFRLFGSLLKQLGFSYQMYLVVIASINIFFISKICKKHSNNPALSMLLYFCFYYLVWTFSGLRQGITIAIGVYYLLEYIKKNKPVKFLVIVIVLTFIHSSALVLLPLYLASRIDFKKKTLIILAFCAVLFAVIPVGSLVARLNWIPFINKAIPYINTSSSFNNILDFQSLGRIAFLIVALFYYDIYTKQNYISKKIMNIYIVSLILYFVFKFSELTAARLSIYGKLLDVIILANIYNLYKEKVNKILYALSLFVLLIFYLNKEMGALEEQTKIINEDSRVMPYTNIFEKDLYEFDNRYYKIMNKLT